MSFVLFIMFYVFLFIRLCTRYLDSKTLFLLRNAACKRGNTKLFVFSLIRQCLKSQFLWTRNKHADDLSIILDNDYLGIILAVFFSFVMIYGGGVNIDRLVTQYNTHCTILIYDFIFWNWSLWIIYPFWGHGKTVITSDCKGRNEIHKMTQDHAKSTFIIPEW